MMQEFETIRKKRNKGADAGFRSDQTRKGLRKQRVDAKEKRRLKNAIRHHQERT